MGDRIMLPGSIKELLKTEEGRDKLYKMYIPTFELVDKYAEELEGKDLLNEYELKDTQQKLTGAYMKLYVVSDTADTVKTNAELDFFDREAEKLRQANKKVTVSDITMQARAHSRDLRTIRNTFLRYSIACEKGIVTCQSILKKQTNEKGYKGADHCGERPDPNTPPPPPYDRVSEGYGESTPGTPEIKPTSEGWD